MSLQQEVAVLGGAWGICLILSQALLGSFHFVWLFCWFWAYMFRIAYGKVVPTKKVFECLHHWVLAHSVFTIFGDIATMLFKDNSLLSLFLFQICTLG
tara:strand:+ start:140 stop:433 length:294 start_codon:yes stop_codon:yes gene_type:complete